MKQDKADANAPKDRGRVLVVDDSRVVRAVVGRALRSAGFHVDEAENGSVALQLLAQRGYDVVVTDLKMPGLDGFATLAGVKRIAPNVEVIILTGAHAEDVSSAVRALRLGAHDYLTKPPANAEAVVLPVERAVEKKRLKDANQRLLSELHAVSRTDGLTGVANRRSFDEALPREFARARRHRHSLSLVMLDIDHFKKINDTYGHQGGDEILRSFAKVAAATLRECDVLYRYGGEEFVALLPETDVHGAMRAAERIVAAVSRESLRVGASSVRITVSAGVASSNSSVLDGADLTARADRALYEAKQGGRNRARASGQGLSLVAGGRS